MSFQSRNILSLLVTLLLPSALYAGDPNWRMPFHSQALDGGAGTPKSWGVEEGANASALYEGASGTVQRTNYPEQNLNQVMMILANAGPNLGKKGKSELEEAQQEFEERVASAMKSIDELFDKGKAIAIKQGNTHAADLIERQRKRFKENRILPSVIRTTQFEKEIVVAVSAIQKAYQSEIVETTRNGDKSKASLLETKAHNQISPYVFDGRRNYVRQGGAVYSIQPDQSWLEVKNRGKTHIYFKEVARRSDFIELKCKTTDIRVRLYNDRVSLKDGYFPWRHFKSGGWAQ